MVAVLIPKKITFGRFKGSNMSGGFNLVGIVEGGPELARKMRELERTAFIECAKIGVEVMGEVLGEAWSDRVPVLDGHYQDSIQTKQRATKNGASGFVGPTPLKGLPRNEQPTEYAAVLEYGNAHQGAQPSGRPAYDAAAGEAVDQATSAMGSRVMELAR